MTAEPLTIDPDIAPYIESVEARLSGLPEVDQSDLIADLTSHLQEVLTEGSADDLHQRIGSPEAYADEFLLTIGVEDRPEEAKMGRVIGRWMASLRRGFSTGGWVRRWLTEMTPAWWALRGLAVGLLLGWDALQVGDDAASPFGRTLAVVLIVAAISASMLMGNRHSRGLGWRWTGYGFTVAGLVAAVVFMSLLNHTISDYRNQVFEYSDVMDQVRYEEELRQWYVGELGLAGDETFQELLESGLLEELIESGVSLEDFLADRGTTITVVP